MSAYGTTWARLGARLHRLGAMARTLRAVRSEYPDLDRLPCSADLDAAADQIELAATGAGDLHAAVVSLAADKSVVAALDVLAGVDLDHLAGGASADGISINAPALMSALETVAARISADERDVVATVAAEELVSLGYAVARSDSTHRSGLWATQGDRVMAVVVSDGGAIELDVAGCDGNECRPEAGRLIRAMRERGLEVDALRATLHMSQDGGSLIRRAGGSADGLVSGEPSQTRRPRRYPRPQRRRIGGHS